MENHSYAGRLLTGITAIFTWFALVVQFVIMINTSTDNHLTKLEAAGRFFAYFTILTNLLVAVNLTSVFLSPSSVPGRFFFKILSGCSNCSLYSYRGYYLQYSSSPLVETGRLAKDSR